MTDSIFENTLFGILFSTGAVILFIGIIFKYFPPKKINVFYGHRTPRAMRNQENWEFAQKHSAMQFIYAGITMLIFSAIAFLLNFNPELEWFGLIVVLSTLLFFVLRTERALKEFENKKS